MLGVGLTADVGGPIRSPILEPMSQQETKYQIKSTFPRGRLSLIPESPKAFIAN
jgi:hypothetical protein